MACQPLAADKTLAGRRFFVCGASWAFARLGTNARRR